MRYFIAFITAGLVMAIPTAAYADGPPKGNDTGCCFSFDDSPVNVIFCTVPGACVITPPK